LQQGGIEKMEVLLLGSPFHHHIIAEPGPVFLSQDFFDVAGFLLEVGIGQVVDEEADFVLDLHTQPNE
jgi:hypothetical protein